MLNKDNKVILEGTRIVFFSDALKIDYVLSYLSLNEMKITKMNLLSVDQ